MLQPFTVFNREGLKIAVIGMANLSEPGIGLRSAESASGILPLNTVEVAQGNYVRRAETLR